MTEFVGDCADHSPEAVTDPAFKTYVINLDRSKERWRDSSRLLDATGLTYERIAGVDGKALTFDESASHRKWQSLVRYGWPVLDGHIGCALSHRRALQQFIDTTDAPYALILEDDHAALPSLAQVVDTVIATLAAKGLSDWTVINLGHDIAKRCSLVDRFQDAETTRRLLAAHDFPMRTTACLWSREGAIGFLNHTDMTYAPVDVMLQDFCARQGGAYLVSPPPVLFREIGSELEAINDAFRPKARPSLFARLRQEALPHLFTEIRNARNLLRTLRNRRRYLSGATNPKPRK